jgi:hypothetical protein
VKFNQILKFIHHLHVLILIQLLIKVSWLPWLIGLLIGCKLGLDEEKTLLIETTLLFHSQFIFRPAQIV